MAVSTKRKNSLKTKSNSKTRKQFKKFRKTKKNIRKMKGGNSDKPKRVFIGHTGLVTSVSFSPDGKYICSGSYDTTVRLWDIETGNIIRTFNNDGNVRSVSFSPDGKTICLGSLDNTVKLWNVNTGEIIRTLTGHIRLVPSNVFSYGHKNFITSVVFSPDPDGKYICSGSADNTVKLWYTETGANIRTLNGHTDDVSSVVFSPDGKYICSGSVDKTVKLWETLTGDLIRTLSGHTSYVNSVSFSPDGKYICSGSYDETVKLWNVENGENIRTLSGHRHSVISVLFSPDGKFICSGSWDNTVKLWYTETGANIHTLNGPTAVLSVAFSRDGEYICSGSFDNTVRLWNIKQIEEEKEKSKKPHTSQSQLLSSKEIKARTYFGYGPNDIINQIDLTKKYKKEALLLHPDKRKNRNTTEDFKELASHYDVLKKI